MKVLVFTTLYPNNVWPNHGVFVKERMTHFAKVNNCEVRILAPVPYFPPLKINHRWVFSQIVEKEIIEGVKVYHPRYFMTPKIGMALYGLMMFWSVLPAVRKIRRKFNFDLIDAHYVYPDGFAAVLLGRLFRKPVVVSARGTDINLFANFWLIRKLLRFTILKADGVIAVSGALKKAIMALQVPKEKVFVIPNGVDASKFYLFPREKARSILCLPNKTLLLSVGNLLPLKGFDLLIKAFKRLLEEFHEKNLYLVIVGEGESRRELETLISSLNLNQHVHLAGSVSHRELYLWYSAADLFCLASSREGWPNVILESLACGTPVVATPVGGIPEIICSEQNGILTERDEQEIAKSISLALKKSWQTDAIMAYARRHAWDQVALSILQVFESVQDRNAAFSNYLNHSNPAANTSHLNTSTKSQAG